VLWSDTRFARAPLLREARLRARGPDPRPRRPSNSLEFGYAKPARGLAVEVLDAAAAASAKRRLAEILMLCAEAGDPVGFLPPPAPERARGV
jgi:hypothetical protein